MSAYAHFMTKIAWRMAFLKTGKKTFFKDLFIDFSRRKSKFNMFFQKLEARLKTNENFFVAEMIFVLPSDIKLTLGVCKSLAEPMCALNFEQKRFWKTKGLHVGSNSLIFHSLTSFQRDFNAKRTFRFFFQNFYFFVSPSYQRFRK